MYLSRWIIKMKKPPAREPRAEDPSPPIALPHQYSDDQRPMSKQKEALASAYLKRSHFSAAAINWSPRYLFPFLVINAGRDIILIISGPISSIACLWLISISFVFHTVILIQWDIKHLNGAEMQRSGVFSLLASALGYCFAVIVFVPPPDD